FDPVGNRVEVIDAFTLTMDRVEDLFMQVEAIQSFQAVVSFLEVGHAGIEGHRYALERDIFRQRLRPFFSERLYAVAMRTAIGEELQNFYLAGGIRRLSRFDRDIPLLGLRVAGRGARRAGA